MYANGIKTPENLKTAYEWLDLSDGIFSKIQLNNTDEISRHTLNKVNLVGVCLKIYENTGDQAYYDKAEKCAHFALKQAEENFTREDYHYTKIGNGHTQIAKLLTIKGEYEEALYHVDFALNMYLDKFTENDADSMGCFGKKGELLYKLERYDEALPLIEKCAQGYPEFMGENHPKTFEIYISLGDCYSKLERHAEAIETYTKAESIAEKIYNPTSKQIKLAREKIALESEILKNR